MKKNKGLITGLVLLLYMVFSILAGCDNSKSKSKCSEDGDCYISYTPPQSQANGLWRMVLVGGAGEPNPGTWSGFHCENTSCVVTKEFQKSPEERTKTTIHCRCK